MNSVNAKRILGQGVDTCCSIKIITRCAPLQTYQKIRTQVTTNTTMDPVFVLRLRSVHTLLQIPLKRTSVWRHIANIISESRIVGLRPEAETHALWGGTPSAYRGPPRPELLVTAPEDPDSGDPSEHARRARAQIGWHYLSNATCLIRPRLFYALFAVSRIIIVCYMIRPC